MQFTLKRLWLMLGFSLLPLGFFVLCAAAVIRGDVIPIPGYWILGAVIPAVTVLLFGLVAFSNTRPIGKTVLLVGVVAAFIFGGGFVGLFTFNYATCDSYTGQQIHEPYAQVLNDLMPQLDDLGEAEHFEFYQYREKALIFLENADILICTYSESEYDKQVTALEQRYVFQTEPMEACDKTCDPVGQVGDYTFRFLAVDGTYDEIYYPKQVVLIGTNDVTSEVAYIAFDDMDLDYINSVEEFVNDYCGWKYVR